MQSGLAAIGAIGSCMVLLAVWSQVHRDNEDSSDHPQNDDGISRALATPESNTQKLHAMNPPGQAAKPAPPTNLPAAAPTKQAPADISVLTYNVCYGCMSDDPKIVKRAGHKLAAMCQAKFCLRNVANVIDKANADIVCLQECENLKTLVSKSKSLSSMRPTVHKAGDEWMATYVSSRFKVEQGLPIHAGAPATAKKRPFQIIWCKDTSNDTAVVIVNVHRKHDPANDRDALSAQFSALVDKELDQTLAAKSPNVVLIVAGDFDDQKGDFRSAKDWKPFKGCKFPDLANKTVKLDKQPPGSCCDDDHSKGAFKGNLEAFDFVMSNAPFTEHNQVAAVTKWTSNHLPMTAALKSEPF